MRCGVVYFLAGRPMAALRAATHSGLSSMPIARSSDASGGRRGCTYRFWLAILLWMNRESEKHTLVNSTGTSFFAERVDVDAVAIVGRAVWVSNPEGVFVIVISGFFFSSSTGFDSNFAIDGFFSTTGTGTRSTSLASVNVGLIATD